METTTSSTPGGVISDPAGANRTVNSSGNGPPAPEGAHRDLMHSKECGLFSHKGLLPGETWEGYAAFHESQLHQLCPRNPLERHLAEEYIGLSWRLRRFPEFEAEIFTRYGISPEGNRRKSSLALVNDLQTDNILTNLAQYESKLRKSALECLKTLLRCRKEGGGNEVNQSHFGF
jgi:hypothetical protein